MSVLRMQALQRREKRRAKKEKKRGDGTQSAGFLGGGNEAAQGRGVVGVDRGAAAGARRVQGRRPSHPDGQLNDFVHRDSRSLASRPALVAW